MARMLKSSLIVTILAAALSGSARFLLIIKWLAVRVIDGDAIYNLSTMPDAGEPRAMHRPNIGMYSKSH